MTTIHASAVLIGPKAVLIRGPSGAGKSALAWSLVEAGRQGVLPFARLIGDDRVEVAAAHARLLVRPAQALDGLLEIRGLGIRRLDYEPVAAVGIVFDIGPPGPDRLPERDQITATIAGITLPRLAAAAPAEAVPLILAFLRTETAGN
jgi:HPr kinase/phosphorylase